MNVYLAQLLCPLRHCIIAAGFTNDEAGAISEAERLLKSPRINRRCGICGSTDLKWETGKTAFKSPEEAQIALMAEQAKQIMTRALLDLQGRTFDEQEKHRRN